MRRTRRYCHARRLRLAKTILGNWLFKGEREEVEKSIKSGVDFVILPANGEVLPSDKKLGKILQIESAISDVLLRTVNELPVDAVLISEDKENGRGLTWIRLMLIHRFSSLLNKPLLIEVLPDICETDLQQIWEAGISGLLFRRCRTGRIYRSDIAQDDR